jgi:hypothetical protein
MINGAVEASQALCGDLRAVPAEDDLFALGREAFASVHGNQTGHVVFARSRSLTPSGAWQGPRDAADALVEESHLGALGGVAGASQAGARTLIASSLVPVTEAHDTGLRVLLRLPFEAGEPEAERLGRLAALASHAGAIDGVIPAPIGEALGLDTLRFFALCRLHGGAPHVIADFARLGPRLAQLCLTFGADELLGPIVAERALRLGQNADNPALTRKEAAVLIRSAGLIAVERQSGGALEECQP